MNTVNETLEALGKLAELRTPTRETTAAAARAAVDLVHQNMVLEQRLKAAKAVFRQQRRALGSARDSLEDLWQAARTCSTDLRRMSELLDAVGVKTGEEVVGPDAAPLAATPATFPKENPVALD